MSLWNELMNTLANLLGPKPRSKATSFGAMKHDEIEKLLKDKLGKKDEPGVIRLSKMRVIFMDETYELTNKNELQKFLNKDKTSRQRYVREAHDCDNFATH